MNHLTKVILDHLAQGGEIKHGVSVHFKGTVLSIDHAGEVTVLREENPKEHENALHDEAYRDEL